MSSYKLIPTETFNTLQTDAGVLVESFDLEGATVAENDVLCATTGGINFTDTPTYTDYGEDIDNCPTNMLELKRIDSHEVKMSGTALTLTEDFAVKLIGAVDTASASKGNSTKLTPRNSLDKSKDFKDLWWVGDYGDGGYLAIHLMNALNTSGFALQTTNKGKGQLAFEFTGHYTMEAQDTVPYEIYMCDSGTKKVASGTASNTSTGTKTN